MTVAGEVVVRRAGPRDADALVRLRVVMFEGIGVDPGPADAPWRSAAAAWFRAAVAGPDAAAFVADDEVSGVVAAAVGVVESWTPGPSAPDGVVGRVFNVATLPAHRRRGHARRCTAALLRWFDEETGAARVELHASGDGIDLYRDLGFAEHGHPTMRRPSPAPRG